MASTDFEVSLITPKQQVFNTNTHMVVAPGAEGYFGVLSLHSPIISLLKPGLLEVHIEHHVSMKYVISYGVASVKDNKYDLMVEDAISLDDINLVLAEQSIARYQAALNTSTSTSKSNNLNRKIDFMKACMELKK